MWPEFEQKQGDPRGSENLGDNYLLLGPKDTKAYKPSHEEQEAIYMLVSNYVDTGDIDWQSVHRWGRLKIPTEQIARSRWKELERCSDMARTDHNIKVGHAI